MQGVGAATGTWCGLGCVGLVVGRELVKFAEEGRNNIKNTSICKTNNYTEYIKQNNSYQLKSLISFSFEAHDVQVRPVPKKHVGAEQGVCSTRGLEYEVK